VISAYTRSSKWRDVRYFAMIALPLNAFEIEMRPRTKVCTSFSRSSRDQKLMWWMLARMCPRAALTANPDTISKSRTYASLAPGSCKHTRMMYGGGLPEIQRGFCAGAIVGDACRSVAAVTQHLACVPAVVLRWTVPTCRGLFRHTRRADAALHPGEES
jgi:hypothetical protein